MGMAMDSGMRMRAALKAHEIARDDAHYAVSVWGYASVEQRRELLRARMELRHAVLMEGANVACEDLRDGKVGG
jgi:hypothetical protein